MTSRPLRAGLVGLAAATAIGLSGCSFLSPVQTSDYAEVGDGVPVDLDAVQVRNLILVAPEAGGPATVSANIANSSGEPVQITFTDNTSKASATFTAPAHSATNVSQTTQVVLGKVSKPPGGMVALAVDTAGTGSTLIDVPVLDAQTYLKHLVPTVTPSAPATPSQTPTAAG